MHFLGLLSDYEKSSTSSDQASQAIYQFLSSPRHSIIDFNAQSDSGTTLLHEAVKRKDTSMIEFVMKKGGDVFVRDRKGRGLLEGCKDEKVRALIRQFSNSDPTLANQSLASSQPPTFRGYMGKWTNLAGGYKTRWFVLENGVLSYYHSQEEEGKQSRGSINMRFAEVRADGNDKHRFEVVSEIASSGSSSFSGKIGRSGGERETKLYLKGNHPVERARWVQLLNRTREHFKLERTQSRESSQGNNGVQGKNHYGSQNPSAANSTSNLLNNVNSGISTGTTSAAPSISRASSLLGAPSAGIPSMVGVPQSATPQNIPTSSKSSLRGGMGGMSDSYGANRSPSILSRNDGDHSSLALRRKVSI